MVSGNRKSELIADMTARAHKITAGVPENLGGHDEGPTPHELLEAALVGCTIITVQMYAKRKGIRLESTDVKVKITSEGKENSVISREIAFRGELSDEERTRLLEIANKCPIHNLLESTIKIETTLT